MARLAVGTAQFGLSYGVSNEAGQTSPVEAKRIVDYLAEQGIDTFDTAALYGESEQVLGEVLAAGWGRIVTKTPQFGADLEPSSARAKLRDSVSASLTKLKRQRVHGLMVHRASDLLGVNGALLWQEMELLREGGQVSKIGVSVYTPEQLAALLDRFPIELVQVPLNVFDQRMVTSGLLTRLRQLKVEIYSRSAYLQGLLLMPMEKIPGYFQSHLRLLEKFQQHALASGLSLQQAALGFVLSLPEVDYVVVGGCDLAQWQQTLAASKTTIDPAQWSELACEDPELLDPSQWQVA